MEEVNQKSSWDYGSYLLAVKVVYKTRGLYPCRVVGFQGFGPNRKYIVDWPGSFQTNPANRNTYSLNELRPYYPYRLLINLPVLHNEKYFAILFIDAKTDTSRTMPFIPFDPKNAVDVRFRQNRKKADLVIVMDALRYRRQLEPPNYSPESSQILESLSGPPCQESLQSFIAALDEDYAKHGLTFPITVQQWMYLLPNRDFPFIVPDYWRTEKDGTLFELRPPNVICQNVRMDEPQPNCAIPRGNDDENRTEPETGARSMKEWRCLVCERIFRNANALRVHVNAEHKGHQAQLPFECRTCKNKYNTENALMRHVNDRHPGTQYLYRELHIENINAKFKCEKCRVGYSTSQHLTHHLYYNHYNEEDFYSCERCNKTFKTNKQLCEHLRRVRNDCEISCYFCEEVFTEVTPKVQHMAEKHDR